MLIDEIRRQLAGAQSLDEVKLILKEYSEIDPEKTWKEIQRHRSSRTEKLDLNELESVSGGADRSWTKDGCAATCEYDSWCGSNDFCYCFDVTYDDFWAACPDGHKHVYERGKCVRCGYHIHSDHPGKPA